MQLVIVVDLGEYLGTELVVVGDIFEGIKLVRSSNANGVNAPLNCSTQAPILSAKTD